MSAIIREQWRRRIKVVAGEAPANMGGPSGQGVGLTLDHPRYYFHLTSRTNRESIQANGLEAGRSLKGRGFTDPRYMRIYLDRQPWEPDATHDVWKVDTQGIHLRPDPELPDRWAVCEQDIPPDRLKLIDMAEGMPQVEGYRTVAVNDGPPQYAPETSPIPPGHYRLFHKTPLRNADSIRRLGLEASRSVQIDFTGEMVWGTAGFDKRLINMMVDGEWALVEYHVEWDRYSTPPKSGGNYTSGSVPPDQIIAVWEPWHFAVWLLVDEMARQNKTLDELVEYHFGFENFPPFQRAVEWLRHNQPPAWMKTTRPS